ncbi:hypothetical protein Lfu02_54240 [Longispora fulva]|nr:hypothetical protein Lfu02_54240 [Longispora fulva]
MAGQAALDEDDGERGVADVVREVVVVEAESEAVLAEEEAHSEVGEQDGEAGAAGEPGRTDAGEYREAGDEKDHVEVVRMHPVPFVGGVFDLFTARGKPIIFQL